jgi:hypothetical protein
MVLSKANTWPRDLIPRFCGLNQHRVAQGSLSPPLQNPQASKAITRNIKSTDKTLFKNRQT